MLLGVVIIVKPFLFGAHMKTAFTFYCRIQSKPWTYTCSPRQNHVNGIIMENRFHSECSLDYTLLMLVLSSIHGLDFKRTVATKLPTPWGKCCSFWKKVNLHNVKQLQTWIKKKKKERRLNLLRDLANIYNWWKKGKVIFPCFPTSFQARKYILKETTFQNSV